MYDLSICISGVGYSYRMDKRKLDLGEDIPSRSATKAPADIPQNCILF